MRIKSIRIRNFRAFEDVLVEPDRYACFVGPNGGGKSTILDALNVFFRTPGRDEVFSEEDFHQRRCDQPFEITLTFSELSSGAKTELKDYVRGDVLRVTAVGTWNTEKKELDVTQFGERMAMRAFASFFENDKQKARVLELQRIYDELRLRFAALPNVKTKEKMIEALRSYEEAHVGECEPLRSADEFYGFAGGTYRLRKFVQWVYVPAVKDARAEQNATRESALGQLLARTVNAKARFGGELERIRADVRMQCEKILDAEQAALESLSTKLTKRLSEWSHPDAKLTLRWYQDPAKAVLITDPVAVLTAGDGPFEGQLHRFGNGLQRSYIMALLQELAQTRDGEPDDIPVLILGVEEPELYQHPPQARHLATVLERLAAGNAQVLLTTHSPLFVSGSEFESVRLVRCTDKTPITRVDAKRAATRLVELGVMRSANGMALLAKLHQALQPNLNEMFFTRRVVFVEGLEDAAYLHAWLMMTNRWTEYRRRGIHTIPTNGKSEMIRPIVVAEQLGIPVFAIWDADADKIGTPDKKQKHERDNKALAMAVGNASMSTFPESPVVEATHVVWPHDIGTALRADVGDDLWNAAGLEASKEFGNAPDLNKCVLHIGARLGHLSGAGIELGLLDSVCDHVLAFGDS